jgi:methionyl aminopeptidase
VSVQKSWAELEKMHRACTILADTLAALAEAAIPGVKTKELDLLARERIERAGAKPVSCHGFPPRCASGQRAGRPRHPGRAHKLKEGDIVG